MKRESSSKKKILDVEPIPPSSLFNSILINAEVDFVDPHSLKKALIKK